MDFVDFEDAFRIAGYAGQFVDVGVVVHRHRKYVRHRATKQERRLFVCQLFF